MLRFNNNQICVAFMDYYWFINFNLSPVSRIRFWKFEPNECGNSFTPLYLCKGFSINFIYFTTNRIHFFLFFFLFWNRFCFNEKWVSVSLLVNEMRQQVICNQFFVCFRFLLFSPYTRSVFCYNFCTLQIFTEEATKSNKFFI